MRKLLCFAIVLLGLPSAADAARRWRGVQARPVLDSTLIRTGTGTFIFETDGLLASSSSCPLAADTRLVVRAPNGQYHHNDNYGASARSRLAISSSGGGTWRIMVFAANADSCGRTDFFITTPGGSRMQEWNDLEFGGFSVSPSGLTTSLLHRYQTANDLDGADDTVLYLFNSSWQLKAEDDNDGIGLASSFNAFPASADQLVMGSYSWASSGEASVFVDDCLYTPDSTAYRHLCNEGGRDSDFDNLSNVMEAALGTDPGKWDTDGDGLFDYNEIFGRRVASTTTEQELRSIGASPTSRDIFLEIDSLHYAPVTPEGIDCPPTPFTGQYRHLSQSLIEQTAAVYAAAGFALHVDKGQPCTNPSLCGDWGHSQIEENVPASPHQNVENAAFYYKRAYFGDHGNFAEVRQGIFRYGLRWRSNKLLPEENPTYCDDSTGKGQANGMSFYFPFATDPSTLKHELGHTLGLRHWGAKTLAEMNHKVNYRSVMNYLYQFSVGMGFSSGALSPINNLNMNEMSWSPGVSKTFLTSDNLGYALCSNQANCAGAVVGDAVDWNMDGRFTSGGVRFDVSHAGDSGGHEGWPLATDTLSISETADSGPALVNANGTLYAFRVSKQGVMRYSKKSTGAWSPWQAMSVGFSLSSTGDTAAAYMPVGGTWSSARIILVHPNPSGKLGYVVVNPINDSVISSAVFPGFPVGVTTRSASVAKDGGSITLVFRNDNGPDGKLWLTSLSSNMVWSTFVAVTVGGLDRASGSTPGIVAAPDNYTYIAHARVGTPQVIDVLSRPTGSTGQWTHLSHPVFVGYQYDALASNTRVNLLYVPYLTGAGVAFSNSDGYLAAFYNSLKDDDDGPRWARAYSRGYTSSQVRSFSSLPSENRSQYIVPNHKRKISLAAALVNNNVALLYGQRNELESTESVLRFVPYANGTPPVAVAGHVDHNDVPEMQAGACGVLLGATGCSARCASGAESNPFGIACGPAVEYDSGECTEPN